MIHLTGIDVAQTSGSDRDITDLAHQIARAFCVRQGSNPDERDDRGKYRWEWYIDEAREAIHLVRKWDERRYESGELGSDVLDHREGSTPSSSAILTPADSKETDSGHGNGRHKQGEDLEKQVALLIYRSFETVTPEIWESIWEWHNDPEHVRQGGKWEVAVNACAIIELVKGAAKEGK